MTAIPTWRGSALEIQAARWMERALDWQEKYDALALQAHAWRRQLIEADLVPVETNPCDGPLNPGQIRKPAFNPSDPEAA